MKHVFYFILTLLKFSYGSNQSHVIAFQKAWDILFDEYGHLYEIARCCEEQLKSVHKIPDDDKNQLKSLSQLLESTVCL